MFFAVLKNAFLHERRAADVVPHLIRPQYVLSEVLVCLTASETPPGPTIYVIGNPTSRPLHTVIAQVCAGVKVWRVRTFLLSSFFCLYTATSVTFGVNDQVQHHDCLLGKTVKVCTVIPICTPHHVETTKQRTEFLERNWGGRRLTEQ